MKYDVVNLNWEQLANNTKQTVEMNLKDWSFIEPVKQLTFDQILAIFSSIKLHRNENGKVSAESTIKNLPDVIKTPDLIVKKEIVLSMLKLFYWAPRSKLLRETQNKAPRFATFTPMSMYAHKLHNNVNYEDWDKSDKFLQYFLGRQLTWLLKMPLDRIPILDSEDIEHNRGLALTYKTGRMAGQQSSLTAYKCNLTKLRCKNTANPGFEFDYVPMPKMGIIMYLQLWIANANIRDTSGSMILNPYEWDLLPEALDIEEQGSRVTGVSLDAGMNW